MKASSPKMINLNIGELVVTGERNFSRKMSHLFFMTLVDQNNYSVFV
jgi:hypothetical protein